MQFENGSNKVVIELRVVQFWSEIILVISNRTRAARWFDQNCTTRSSITIINYTNTFYLATAINERVDERGQPIFGTKPKVWRHKTFIFSLLLICTICFCDYKPLFLNNAFQHQANWYTNFPRFQGAQLDYVRVQSSRCCFPRASLSFDEWHVTHSPPIRKRI